MTYDKRRALSYQILAPTGAAYAACTIVIWAGKPYVDVRTSTAAMIVVVGLFALLLAARLWGIAAVAYAFMIGFSPCLMTLEVSTPGGLRLGGVVEATSWVITAMVGGLAAIVGTVACAASADAQRTTVEVDDLGRFVRFAALGVAAYLVFARPLSGVAYEDAAPIAIASMVALIADMKVLRAVRLLEVDTHPELQRSLDEPCACGAGCAAVVHRVASTYRDARPSGAVGCLARQGASLRAEMAIAGDLVLPAVLLFHAIGS